ncbi:MAG: alpha/beta fold hydrolase [Archangium sp.]
MTGLVMLVVMMNPEAVARDTVADLDARAFERVAKRFDSKMSAALPADKLAPVWDQVTKQFGAFKVIKSVTVEKKDPMQVASVTSQFERSDLLITIAVDAEGKVSGLFFKPLGPAFTWTPPSYAGEVEAREVVIGPLTLPGTLTLPKKSGPFRAVVFVHGSGPNDRDETTGANKLFKDLALGLASRGIASLRYEKRTRFAPASMTGNYTMKEEVTDDVKEAVTLLAKTKEIDGKHIVVLGHSLGGWLAPRIANEEPRIAAIAIFAGPTRPLDVLVREQIKVTAPGDQNIAAKVEAFSKQFNDPKLSADTEVDFLGAKLPGAYVIDLRTYDAKQAVAKTKQPIFIAHGGRDYQVAQADLDGWKNAVAGRTDVVIQRYPKLNHHFLEGEGPSTPAEYLKPGHVPLTVIDELASWVKGLK